MHKLSDFEDFSLCSTLSGVFSDHKSNAMKCCFSKHKIKICVAFSLFAMILIIIYYLKSISLSKTLKIVTKRSINEDENFFKTLKINIEVTPENQKFRNLIEKESEENSETLLKRSNSREGWSSEPFESKINKHFGQTQEILSKGVQKPEEQNKLTDLGSSMRLKGVYIKSESLPENHSDGKFLYSKEINNLMSSNFNEGKQGKKLPPRSLNFKSQGSPFQLPTKGQGSLGREKINLNLNQFFKRQPITLYLEFYPMRDLQGLERKFKPNSNAFKQPENKFHTSEMSYSFNVEKIISPQDNRNRMIMKLNLYPKELNLPKHHFSKKRRISRSKYNLRPERKSFGWFHNQKKNNLNKCSFMRIHPRGKLITAKWKNERGEWIHADHVAVKNLEKEKFLKNKRVFLI